MAARPVFDKFLTARDYTAALKSLAPLKTPVDAFFEKVTVNAPDPRIRENRLRMLSEIRTHHKQLAAAQTSKAPPGFSELG